MIAAGPAEAGQGAPADPVAIVAGAGIPGADFRDYLAGYVRSRLYHGGSEAQLQALADEALEAMITERLLLDAARRRGIAGDRAAAAGRIAALRARYGESPGWAEMESRLPAIEARLLGDSAIEALRAEVTAVAEPGEAALRAFYDARPELFTEPASHEIGLILLGVPPSATAAEWQEAGRRAAAVHREIAEGAGFAETAARFSTHDSAAAGGAVGRVHRGQLPDAAQAALEAMAPGSVSDPVRILEGYLILRLDRRNPATLQPFERVRARAGALYRRERAEAQWTAFVAELRAGTPVQSFDTGPHVRLMMSGH